MSGSHNITDTNEAHWPAMDRLAVRSVQAYPARRLFSDAARLVLAIVGTALIASPIIILAALEHVK